jgi:uncharacterized protein (DUF488 family)
MSHPSILTIGHSNHSLEHFVSLLRCHLVQVVADVRSHPYSAYASTFDHEALAKSLHTAGFQYVYLGNELGGRPRGHVYYDTDGRVLYGKVAESSAFRSGLARLEKGLRQSIVAVLCAEENPAGCHRRLLVSRVLAERGVMVQHIRGDGRLQTEGELQDAQLSLFDGTEAPAWKSIPSVLLKKRQSSSSAF